MTIERILTRERIRIGIRVKDWRELVDRVGDIMVAAGDVQPSYVEAMKKVIEELGPYSVIAPGVVLLHARPEEGAKRICLAMATLQDGINFGSKNDPVYLAIGLGAVDHTSHIQVLRELALFLENKDRLALLMKAQSEDELLRILLDPEHSGQHQ